MIHKRHILLLCLIIIAFPQLVMASKTHVARKSESLHTIARKYNVSVKELKSVNNVTGTKVTKGARLIIPSASSATKKTRVAEKARFYRVVKGDTLPKIAKKTGIKMSDLRRFNSLKGNRVKSGQLLAINLPAPLVEDSPRTQAALNRLQMVSKDLLNEQEFDSTLAELTDIDADRPVDLAKNIEDNSSSVNSLKKTAYSFLGARYRFGGNSRNALDCSSFIQQVFRDHNINLPRTAREQFHAGSVVPRGDLKKGDLVFFQTYAHFPSHVGIYLGNRKMIHASSRDRRVVISSMDTPYYLSRFLGARRIGAVPSDNFNELLAGVEEERESDVLANDTLGVLLTLNN